MNFISLFSGIGGFDLGFERAGMECIAQVEIDPFCQKVLQKHWPHVKRFGDVRDVGKQNLPCADVILGGFPCQPHSTAGKRLGASDDRNLWPEYLRIVDELKPSWVVAENVPGIRTTILDQVLSDLESLDYSAVALSIPACAFNAPHRRERIFVIADASGLSIRLPGFKWQENIHAEWLGKKQDASNSSGQGLQEWQAQQETSVRSTQRAGMGTSREANYWIAQPGICGVVDGLSDRLDRVRSLGNAVVPQVAEFIASLIIQAQGAL